MNFEWNDTKRKSNIEKHGIDFIDAPMIFAGYTLAIEDDYHDYGEECFVTFGILGGRSRCGCSHRNRSFDKNYFNTKGDKI